MIGLAVLTRGLFDYAGMFPPAALDFEAALAESARFPTDLRRPDLVAADMVLTPEDADRLTPEAFDAAGFDRPCRLCVVGVAAKEASDRAAWCHDVKARGIDAVSLEVHAEGPDVGDALGHALGVAPEGTRLYFEPKWDPAMWATDAGRIWSMLQALGGEVGIKVRCAGPTALDAPTLAAVLHGAAQRDLPVKLTQGLHHPYPNDPRYDNAHGFINAAVALRLAQAGQADEAMVETILLDDEPASFVLDQGIGWREHRIMVQQLQQVMASHPFSIGSCSLAEPDGDLARLA